MSDAKKRLTGDALIHFLRGLGIERLDPVGRTSASGASADEAALSELLQVGDPVPPVQGTIAEDVLTVGKLFEQHGREACFGLTPDGHLSNHQAMRFDAEMAALQVIALVEAEIAEDDRDEVLALTWLVLAYHNHDHPADLGGLLLGADGRPRCCYLDIKRTQASAVKSQRSKLEQRSRERKLGLMAQTVTRAANDGFAGYPGRGQPGLCVTLLHNPVQAGRQQAGFALNWFVGIASNYQASDARWGWGGPRGAKLPDELAEQLRQREAMIGTEPRNWLQLLEEYRDYAQYRGDDGQWDRETLRATLEAKALAARYLLMNEDIVEQAESSLDNLQPEGVSTRLKLEDFMPGESIASYFGRRADEAGRRADEAGRKLDENTRELDEATRERDEALRQVERGVERRRQRGHADADIAEDLGLALADFLQRFPPRA